MTGNLGAGDTDATPLDRHPIRVLCAAADAVLDVGPPFVAVSQPCDVVAYDPPGRFAYTVGDRFDGTSAMRWASWSPRPPGALVEQNFEHLPDGPRGGSRLKVEELDATNAFIAERRNEPCDGMTQTLERMRAVYRT
jgi:hypothetical protein